MIYDVQKASILKRISAWVLDMILLLILMTGVATVVSYAVDMTGHNAEMDSHYDRYEKEYGVDFDISVEKYQELSQEEKDRYDDAYEALIGDKEVLRTYDLVVNLTLIITSLSILISFLILEFAVPMFLQNGQTVGKKIFGIAVMRTNGVKINGVCLFIRAILGKCTLETMVPVMIVVMIILGITGFKGTLLILALGIAQVVLLAFTANHYQIHDKLADTVAVDMSTQMIFASDEDLIEYKKRMAAEDADRRTY